MFPTAIRTESSGALPISLPLVTASTLPPSTTSHGSTDLFHRLPDTLSALAIGLLSFKDQMNMQCSHKTGYIPYSIILKNSNPTIYKAFLYAVQRVLAEKTLLEQEERANGTLGGASASCRALRNPLLAIAEVVSSMVSQGRDPRTIQCDFTTLPLTEASGLLRSPYGLTLWENHLESLPSELSIFQRCWKLAIAATPSVTTSSSSLSSSSSSSSSSSALSSTPTTSSLRTTLLVTLCTNFLKRNVLLGEDDSFSFDVAEIMNQFISLKPNSSALFDIHAAHFQINGRSILYFQLAELVPAGLRPLFIRPDRVVELVRIVATHENLLDAFVAANVHGAASDNEADATEIHQDVLRSLRTNAPECIQKYDELTKDLVPGTVTLTTHLNFFTQACKSASESSTTIVDV